MIPSTAPQLLIALVFVLPGVTFLAVRARLNGPSPEDQNTSDKVLRALAFSAVFGAIYAIVLGEWLVESLFGSEEDRRLGDVLDRPREAGLAALVLLFAVPALVAALDYARRRHNLGPRTAYDPTPRAWDFAFAGRDECFVRLRLADGRWVGGWLGTNSFASSFPQPDDIYIERAWRLDSVGDFVAPQPGSLGMWVRCDDVDVMEFIDEVSP